jgi:tetratricopeptide (TPR) repeat protein
MRNSPMTLKALSLLTLGAGLIACEDLSKQPSKASATQTSTSTTVAEAPKAPEAPVPAQTPPTPTTPEMKKEDPIAKKHATKEISGDDDETESASLTELLSRTREALSGGDTDRALKLAARTVKKAPKRSSAWNLLGRAQLQAGKRKLALASFEKAVELNPNNSYAQNNLGLTLIYDGKYEEAIEALETATDHEPVEGFMWNNLGIAYEHVDRLDDAREAYVKGAEMDSDNARESLARLAGVRSVVRTAKVDSAPKATKPAEEPAPATTQ